jgi:hypothetical protein
MFSKIQPKLQLVWDSTSLSELLFCPRRYELRILEHWVPVEESEHITFGLNFHSALEAFDKARVGGVPYEEAMLLATRTALRNTRRWQSTNKNKNRFTLVRTVVWYIDHYGADDPAKVLVVNGEPAVEVSFRLPLHLTSSNDEEFVLAGHLDGIIQFGSEQYTTIRERKTTKNTIGNDYFRRFSPDTQVSVYTFASHVILPEPALRVMIDAAQVAVNFSRFQRGFTHRTPAQLDEFLKNLKYWLSQVELYAQTNYWPQNTRNCFMCPYQNVCGKDPSVREEYLKTNFIKRQWNTEDVR